MMFSFLKNGLNTDYGILKNRDFLFVSLTRSLFVQTKLIRATIMGWFIYEATGSPFHLAWLALVESVPYMASVIFSGYMSDKYGRRKPTLTLASCIGVLSLILCYLISREVTPAILVGIYMCTAAFGLARGSLGGGTLQSWISLIVSRKDTHKATVWDGIFMQSSFVMAPILGGLLYRHFGVVTANAAVIVFALLSCLMICTVKDIVVADDDVKDNIPNEWHRLTEGFRFIFSHQMLKATVLLDFIAVILSGVTGLLPIFAKDVLDLGPDGLGYLRASISVGSLSAGIFLAHYHLRGYVGRQFLYATMAFCLSLLIFSQSTILYFSMLFLFLSGACDWYGTMIRSTVARLMTPNRLHGRVAAARTFFANSANEVNNFNSAMWAGLIGVVPAVVAGGVLTLIVVALTAWKAPQLRSITMERLVEDNG